MAKSVRLSRLGQTAELSRRCRSVEPGKPINKSVAGFVKLQLSKKGQYFEVADRDTTAGPRSFEKPIEELLP